MPLPDTTTVHDAIDALAQGSYQAGQADQAIEGQKALEELDAQWQEKYDAYVASHSYTPPPPPPPSGVMFGMNFEKTPTGNNAKYEKSAHCARIYVDNGLTDIHSQKQFARAYADGVRDYEFSTKETTVPRWLGTVPDDCTWILISHHEPEDNIADGEYSLATWNQWQVDLNKAVRAAGGSPWICLMSWTLNPKSGRKPSDYYAAAKAADGVFFDFYPSQQNKVTQAQVIGWMRDFAKASGAKKLGIAEYGVLMSDPTNGVKLIKEMKGLTTDFAKVDYWSNQKDSTAPDYHLTDATAAAFFS